MKAKRKVVVEFSLDAFQFLIGSMKVYECVGLVFWNRVSIPYRFNESSIQAYIYSLLLHVSIPYRFNESPI